jgi:hypothetical protein
MNRGLQDAGRQVVRRIDQPDVRECLREITELPA